MMTHQPNAVEVHAKGCANVMLGLSTDRRIRGRVLDATGRPAAGVPVQALTTNALGQSNGLPFVTDEVRSGDNGRFEIINLKPGDYYVGVNLVRTPSNESPYSRYFFAETADPRNATLVHLDEGAGVRENVDFHLPRRQRGKSLEGVVVWPDGRGGNGVLIFLEDPRWPWQTYVVAATADAQGKFRVQLFDGTKYRVHAVINARSRDETTSAEPLAIDAAAVTEPVRLVLIRSDCRQPPLTLIYSRFF